MLKSLKQILPSSACLKCDVCCRYADRTTTYVPYFFIDEAKKVGNKIKMFPAVGEMLDLKTPPVSHKGNYICPFFAPEKNDCRIYPKRPFDCRLYPFMVTYDKDFKSVLLVLDKKCPYFTDKLDSEKLKSYIDYIVDILEGEDMVEEINANKNFINDFQEDSILLKRLENLTKKICYPECGLKRISLDDKILFDECFSKIDTPLSNFSFPAIYIWSGALNILWKKIGSTLCIFAGSNNDYFLLLPPVDKMLDKSAVKESLEILSYLNKGKSAAARIENIPEEFLESIVSLGLKPGMTSQEYIYNQKDLAELKGNRFKSKRSTLNYFVKNHTYDYRELGKKDIFECLELYREWAKQRLRDIKDDYYRVLIEDSYFAQKTALMNLKSLDLRARLVEIDGYIKGYSLGYPLNKDIFVVLFETTDLSVEGLPQFIFREFCNELPNYKYINTMSDSGLENLRISKESYRPIKKALIFTAYV